MPREKRTRKPSEHAIPLLFVCLVAFGPAALLFKLSWDLSYIRGFFIDKVFAVVFLLAGLGLSYVGFISLKIRSDQNKLTAILFVGICILGAMINLYCVNVYGAWKRIVKYRFYQQVEIEETKALLHKEVERLQSTIPQEPFASHHYTVYNPDQSDVEESLLAATINGFPTKYATLLVNESGKPYLFLNNGGGFLMPWGVLIGLSEISDSTYTFSPSTVEKWEEEVLFIDVNMP